MKDRKFYKVEEIKIENIKVNDRFLIRDPNNVIVMKNGQIVFKANTSAKQDENGKWGLSVKLHDAQATEDPFGEVSYTPVGKDIYEEDEPYGLPSGCVSKSIVPLAEYSSQCDNKEK